MPDATAQRPYTPTGPYKETKNQLPPLSSMLQYLNSLSTNTQNSPSLENPKFTPSREVIGRTIADHSRTNKRRRMIDRSLRNPRFNPSLSDGSFEPSDYCHGLSRSPNERTEMDVQSMTQHGLERSDMDAQVYSHPSNKDGDTSSYSCGCARPSWISKEQEVEDSLRTDSFMSLKHSGPSPAYLSPSMKSATRPSYIHHRVLTSTFGGQAYPINRSAQLPPPSVTAEFSSDPYSMDKFSTVYSSSSLCAPSQHFYRSQVRSSTSPFEIASTSSIRMGFFNDLWGLMMEVRKHIERFQFKASAAVPRPLPSIRDDDVATLISHLKCEIGVLAEADGRSADHFALNVRHLHDQFFQQSQSMHARSNSLSVASDRACSSTLHYCTQQQYHSSSFIPPLIHPRESAPSSQIPLDASYTYSMPCGYGDTPSSAPLFAHGQEMNFSTYNFHRNEYGTHDQDMINQRAKEFDHRFSSAYATPLYASQSISSPFSLQNRIPSLIAEHSGNAFFLPPHQERLSRAMPKRVRKRQDEAEQSCLACSAKETPEWRKGPTGPRTLCNACGLLFAKQSQKSESSHQAQGKRQRGFLTGRGNEMTQQECERRLLELQSAIKKRDNESNLFK